MRYTKIDKGILEVTQEFTHQVTKEGLRADRHKMRQELEDLKIRIGKIDEMIEALREEGDPEPNEEGEA